MLTLFQNKIFKNNKGLLFGVGAFVINSFLTYFPFFSEKIYRNTIYQTIRWFWDLIIGEIPFLGFFLLLSIIFLYFKKNQSISKGLKMLNFFGYLVFFFYILWGFNYSAVNVNEKIGLNTQKIKVIELVEHLDETIAKAAVYRSFLESSIIVDNQLPDDLEATIRPLVESTLIDFGYPVIGKVRCREISSSGWMRSMGISGIYFPFTLESYIDGSQTAISKTFTMAHEMAHGYGITNEGEANFIAYVTLTHSEDYLLQYIGYYELMTYELVRLRNYDYDLYQSFEESLPHWIKEDLKNQRENSQKHKSKFPWLSNRMNDLYLKSQGVEQGIASYNSVIDLVIAYEVEK